MTALFAARKSQMMLAASIPGVAAPHLFDVPNFILEQFEPWQRPLVLLRAMQMCTVNPAGASDLATRKAWQAAIDRKQGGGDGRAQRQVLQG